MKLSPTQAVAYGARWVRSHVPGAKEAYPPRLLSLPITDNCNARCVMCDVWKTRSKDELTPEQLTAILGDRLFAEVEHVGISGGEPTLRADLPELVDVVLQALPRLASLSITSHGFHTNRWRHFLEHIVPRCQAKGVAFTLNLSVDGVDDVHDRVRGIPGAFDRVQATHRVAEELGARVLWQCTVSTTNVYSVGDVLRRSRQAHTEIQFRQATEIARLHNEQSIQAVALDASEKSFFADFLHSRAVLDATPSPARRLFYADLAKRLTSGARRGAPCSFQAEGVVLDAHGELFQCSISTKSLGNAREVSAWDLYFSPHATDVRSSLLANVCPSCVHDQSGTWAPHALVAEAVGHTEPGKKVLLGMRAATLATKAPVVLRARRALAHVPSTIARDGTALIIGAYGGEHVGDAAILGGVILRLVADHGIHRAIVASSRADRTEHWVKGLRLPVPVEVVRSEQVRDYLASATALVWAGGPVMDLPELLAEHLATVVTANQLGIPFILEGIGIGPFRLAPSRELAKLLVKLSTAIRVRSNQALETATGWGVPPALGKDPAFDYLATRTKLDAISMKEQASLDRVFAKPTAARVVAINLRPFWHKYSSASREDVAVTEELFLARFGQGLRAFAQTAPITYVFFPMNPDQYGFSDLTSAYALREHLAGVDFRIWEAEPGIDAVLALLRRVNAALTMRYHASIFALSQNVPTVGIDYQLGATGKVGALFAESGKSSALRAADVAPDDVVARLRELVP